MIRRFGKNPSLISKSPNIQILISQLPNFRFIDMKEITVFSPAKLNLYLNVLNRRPDGYHNIVTLFEKIDLCDEIIVKKRSKGIEIRTDSENLSVGRDNLMYRAVEEVSNFLNKSLGVDIFIKKNIPISSGLGGGSSNAASIINAVQRLYDLSLDKESLLYIARRLGADVGFFLSDYTYAIGRGIGDELEKIDSTLLLSQVLIWPRLNISTADMYKKLDSFNEDMGLTERNSSVKLLKQSIENSDISLIGKRLFNVFEGLLLQEELQVKRAKELLNQSGSVGTCLSGSGPTVFGIFRDRKEAIALQENLRLKGCRWEIFVVATYGG